MIFLGLADNLDAQKFKIKEKIMKPRLIRVSPSILAVDYNDDKVLTESLSKIERAGANFVHLDVMDGKFVKNTTFDDKLVYKVRDMTGLLLDVHLMVESPEKVIDKYAAAGADIITVHYEACKNLPETLKRIKDKNIIAGVAINPETSVLKIKDIIDSGLVDLVLVMSVKPGKSGQTFIRGMAEKVAEVRELNKKVFIEIDGGVNTKNAKILRRMGVNILVSGATIFNSKSVRKTIRQLKGSGLVNRLREVLD